MSRTTRQLSALVLGLPNPVSMGIVRGFMMAGHKVAAVWYPERLRNTRVLEQDRALSSRAPGLTLHGLRDKAGVAVKAVPRFRDWPEGARLAADQKVDVVISVLYPDRITPEVLSTFPARVVNLHPSLLPAYRGPDPVFNMLWDQTINHYSGFTLHMVSPAFDTGDVLGQQRVPFPANLNLSVYYMELIKAGTALLCSCLPRLLSGELRGEPQADAANAPQGNRKPAEAVLDSAMTRERVAWLCATIPQMTRLTVEGLTPPAAVQCLVSSTPLRTERPPVFTGGLVSFDVADGHVTVRVGSAP